MQPLSSILFQFPVQGDYGVSRGAASRLARVYARERAVACKRALARVCATLIACAAAAQKPNELECLLSCLRSPLCARLPARLSPRVRFETRIKQTALMPDPCRSAPLPPPLLSAARRRRWRRHRSRTDARFSPAIFLSRRRGIATLWRGWRLLDLLLRFQTDQTESRTLTCRCARLSARSIASIANGFLPDREFLRSSHRGIMGRGGVRWKCAVRTMISPREVGVIMEILRISDDWILELLRLFLARTS